MDRRRLRIRQVRGMLVLLAQSSPVELHKRMFLRNFLDDLLGNARALSQTRQMELLYFFAAAHVVHQVERIPFAADKSHGFTSNQRHSV